MFKIKIKDIDDLRENRFKMMEVPEDESVENPILGDILMCYGRDQIDEFISLGVYIKNV